MRQPGSRVAERRRVTVGDNWPINSRPASQFGRWQEEKDGGGGGLGIITPCLRPCNTTGDARHRACPWNAPGEILNLWLSGTKQPGFTRTQHAVLHGIHGFASPQDDSPVAFGRYHQPCNITTILTTSAHAITRCIMFFPAQKRSPARASPGPV